MVLFSPHQRIFNPKTSIVQEGAGKIKPSCKVLVETPLESKKRLLLELLSYTFKGELKMKFISPKNYGTDFAIEHFHDQLLNHLNMVESVILFWVRDPEKYAGRKDAAYADLQKLESFYASLPYGEMKGREECYPLFAIRDMLPPLHAVLDRFFQELNGKPVDLGIMLESIHVAKLEIIKIHELHCGSMRRLSSEISGSGGGLDADIPAFDTAFSTLKEPADEQKTLAALKDEANGLARFYFHRWAAPFVQFGKCKKYRNRAAIQKKRRIRKISKSSDSWN